jgi:hypothetical protein
MASTQLVTPPSYDNHGFVAAEAGAAAADSQRLDKHQAKLAFDSYCSLFVSNDYTAHSVVHESLVAHTYVIAGGRPFGEGLQ